MEINAGGDAVQPRPMDPKNDLAVYGYGSVTWKERMEEWKKRQNGKIEVVMHEGGSHGDKNGDEHDDPDLPKYVLLVYYLILFNSYHL